MIAVFGRLKVFFGRFRNKQKAEGLEVKIDRYYATGEPFIRIKRPNVSPENIWSQGMADKAFSFSPRELRRIYYQCRAILEKMDSDDKPFDYVDMVDDFEDVLVEMGVSLIEEKEERTLSEMGVPDIDKIL
jgi:hypothetical protein